MATKKFPSEMSSRGTVLGTDKILIYNATTGASDEVSTIAQLFTYLLSAAATFSSSVSATRFNVANSATNGSESNPFYDIALTGQASNQLTSISFGNSRNSSYSTTIKFVVNAASAVDTPINSLILGKDGIATFISDVYSAGITLSADNANKPGAGGLWTVTSDERIKTDIELADLDICYDTIKNIPLKRYAWADGVYSAEQVSDRHNLGWIAQDVQKYFSKAVSVKPFTKNAKIADVTEEYQEQDFVMEDKKVTSIEMINGSPVQVTKTVQEKVLLFDELPVKDELGKVVLENGKPLLAKVPKMVTKTRPKFRQEVIEDCLDLNSGQLNAALYGAVQACMLKIESLEKEIALLKQ